MTTLRVDVAGPFDAAAALATLAAHTVEGLHRHDPDAAAHTRVLVVGGEAHAVTVVLDGQGVTLAVDTGDSATRARLAERVRHWFDLDADAARIDAWLAKDPLLADQVRLRPGVRATRFPDGFEAAVLAVLGQQVSLAAARRLGSRLVAAYGAPGPAGLALFPTPRRLVDEPVEPLRAALGVPAARARTVRAVAELFAAGFTLDGACTPETARARLLTVAGIGPWTADYLCLRVLGAPDVFPSSDAVLRRGLGGLTARGADAHAARWAPYRSYGAARVWAEAAAS